MSKQRITAEEASCVTVQIKPKSVEDILDDIDARIKRETKKGNKSSLSEYPKQDIDSVDLKVIVSDIESRGFTVRYSIGQVSHFIDVIWP